MSEDNQFDAEMDPWCTVFLDNEQTILYGFCTRHPATGGLSWTHSTPIQMLDEANGRAQTISGRRYKLGRRINAEDIPSESEEGWIAFDLMLSAHSAIELPAISAEPGNDSLWVTSCKVARHLGIAPPRRVPREVEDFMDRNLNRYLELKRHWP